MLRRFDEAEKIFESDQEELSSSSEAGALVIELLQYATMLMERGQHTRAIAVLRHRALPFATKLGLAEGVAYAWVALGLVQRARGEHRLAIEAWKEHALPLVDRLGVLSERVGLRVNVAMELVALGRPAAARRFLVRDPLVAEVLRQEGGISATVKDFSDLAKALAATGAHAEAAALLARAGLPPLDEPEAEPPPRARAGPEVFGSGGSGG